MHQKPSGVYVFDTYDALTDFLAARWCELADDAIGRKGRFAVALSGGRTPEGFYRKLAAGRHASGTGQTHIFLADERFVPPDSRDSNYRMVREALSRDADGPFGIIHPVSTLGKNPETAARKYEEALRDFFHPPSDGFPEFDLILLGLGEDGHTASLFPGSPALEERSRFVCAVSTATVRHERITLSLPVINRARHIIFMVTGAPKAGVLREVIEKQNPALPATKVKPLSGSLLYLLDRDSGILLSETVFTRK